MRRTFCILASVVLSLAPAVAQAQKKSGATPHPPKPPSYHPPKAPSFHPSRAAMPHPARPPAHAYKPATKMATKSQAPHPHPGNTTKPPTAAKIQPQTAKTTPSHKPSSGSLKLKTPSQAPKPAIAAAKPETRPKVVPQSVAMKRTKTRLPPASTTKNSRPAAAAALTGSVASALVGSVPSALNGSVPSALPGSFPSALPGFVPSALPSATIKTRAATQVASIPRSVVTPGARRSSRTSNTVLLVPQSILPGTGLYSFNRGRSYGRRHSYGYGYPYRHRYHGPYRNRSRTYRPVINRAAIWEMNQYQQLLADLNTIRPGTFAGGPESQALAKDLAACVKPPLRIETQLTQGLANRVVSALASRTARRTIDAPDLARSLFIAVNGGRLPITEGGGMTSEPEVIADIEQILRFSGATQVTARAVSHDLKSLARL